MDISNLKVNRANAVLIFEQINISRISRDTLRELLDNEIPDYAEHSGIIVVKYPLSKAEIIILTDEAKRLEVKINEPSDDTWDLLPQLAYKSYKSLKDADIKYYGFNFFSELQSSEDVRKFLLSQFEKSLIDIRHTLDANLVSMSVQLNYVKDDISYQLNIIPELQNGEHFILNFNTQFQADQIPELDDLLTQFHGTKDYFFHTLKQLFEETN